MLWKRDKRIPPLILIIYIMGLVTISIIFHEVVHLYQVRDTGGSNRIIIYDSERPGVAYIEYNKEKYPEDRWLPDEVTAYFVQSVVFIYGLYYMYNYKKRIRLINDDEEE